MHEVVVTYKSIPDYESFLSHYRTIHIPLVLQLPELEEFTWGIVQTPEVDDPKLIARMVYASREAADRSFNSNEGAAAISDVENFATEGVAVLHVSVEML